MKKLIIIAGSIALFGCGTPKPGTYEAFKAQKEETKKEMTKTLDAAPAWFLKPPVDNYALYEKATAKSHDMQMAVIKATALARAQLALSIEGEINANIKLFMDEVGQDPTISNMNSVTTSQDVLLAKLHGVQQEDCKIMIEDTHYVAYILIKYPLGEMNRVLIEKIKSNSVLESRLRASKSFNELEKKVDNARRNATQ